MKLFNNTIARTVTAAVLLLAVLMVQGFGVLEAVAAETTAAEATVAADGNPNDETAKGSYTATDEAVRATANEVVATVGGIPLTNGQLQVCYWMEVQSFLSNYGSYASYFGLDLTQPLETQVCGLSEKQETWQQFFLAGALNTWQNYQALTAEAEANGFVLPAEDQAQLDSLPQTMEQNALMYGFETVEELLKYNVGGGATLEDYMHFMQTYLPGTAYFNGLVEDHEITDEDVEAYFTEHEQTYLESGLARTDKAVDVRHVLIMPEGATSANIRTETFDEAAWETSRGVAEDLLQQWEQGDKSEESFAQLAKDHSQDGSAADGGLFTGVTKGQMVEAFENWCFDEERQPGDYGLVQTEFGYHLMFYVAGHPLWPDYARSDMQNAYAQELLNEILAKYPLEVSFNKILLAAVDMTGGAAQEEQEDAVIPAEPASETLNADNMPVIIIAGLSIAALLAVAFIANKKEHE